MQNRDRHDPREPEGNPRVAPHAALEEVGDFHFGTDAFSTALEYYEGAVRGFGVEQEFDPGVAARLNRKIADCYRAKGLLDEALAALDRASGFLETASNDVETGIVLGRRADVLSAQGKHEEAMRVVGRALEILRATAAHREYGLALKTAATCQGRLGRASEFEQLNLDALAAFRRIEDQDGMADVLNNLGLAAKNACQWDKALRSLTRALEIREQLGLSRRLARTLGNLGIVYTKTRDFHEAIAHLRRARKLATSLGDYSTLISVQNSLGRVLTMTGRYSLAERCLLEARVLSEKHSQARSLALADEFLGDLMLAQGRLAEARQNYESGLKKARSIAPKGDVVGEILRRLAELELRSGLRSQAIATAKRALRVCEGCGELHEIGFVHRTLGLALRDLGKLDAAAASLGDSVAAFERTNNPFETAWSRVEIARLRLDQGGRENLLRAMREAQAAVDAFRSLEEDAGYCAAGLTLVRAQKLLGNLDEALLSLCDVERVCEDCNCGDLLDEARTLRRELEYGLAAHASGEGGSVNLFHELYALSDADIPFESGLEAALGSLRDKTRSTAVLLAVRLPARSEPRVVATSGMPAGEARRVAQWFASNGDGLQVKAHVDGSFAAEFPEIAARAAAAICQPLVVEGRNLGLLYLERSRGELAFAQDEIDFVATYAGLAALLLRDQLHEDLLASPETLPGREALHPVMRRVLTVDPGMLRILALAERVAGSNCTVLLAGETGTGKGLLAHCIHLASERRDRRFIALNCAALPEPLLESELFGHVRGAFTGADAEKKGLLEAANGGTVFLDEVGKTSLFMQGKLLQFLDSMEVRPVGSNLYRKVDVRVLCASKGNLRDLVEQGQLLEDLYFRLNDFPIVIPPLRARRGDIRLLAEHYLRVLSAEMKRSIPGFSRQAMQILESYSWPGNVRELEKCVKRAIILGEDRQPITVRHLPDEVKSAETRATEAAVAEEGLTLRERVALLESQVIRSALLRTAGNKSEAARLLGVSYPSLLQKIKLYGVGFEPEA